jgi:hypothetical protein
MALPSVSPRIAREDYTAFRILLGTDPEFPDSFEAWQSLCLRNDAKRVNGGHAIREVSIAPAEFGEYCRGCGREPTAAMLLAFAVVKTARTPLAVAKPGPRSDDSP